ncbi:hypothetical protein ACRQU7_01445 [Caproiciproducens sp. R1]|uniref:hypothetical protein n=1 Tax=Acutalibacteraceae TaxID=3082771 RepID=UPI002E0E9D2A
MLKFKSKKLVAICCAIALIVSSAIPAFAATNSITQWFVNFPAFRTGITCAHGPVDSTSGTDSTFVQLDYLGPEPGSYQAYFLIRRWDNHNTISDTVYMTQGDTHNISLNQHYNKGAVLELFGGNDNPAFSAGANGYVDFH